MAVDGSCVHELEQPLFVLPNLYQVAAAQVGDELIDAHPNDKTNVVIAALCSLLVSDKVEYAFYAVHRFSVDLGGNCV